MIKNQIFSPLLDRLDLLFFLGRCPIPYFGLNPIDPWSSYQTLNLICAHLSGFECSKWELVRIEEASPYSDEPILGEVCVDLQPISDE